MKHGNDAESCVILGWTVEHVTLSVSDNGPGSENVIMPYSDLVRRHHFGIVGMYQWAETVEGELRIDQNKPTGVKVAFTCPLHKKQSAVLD